jgi:hypothetical protein
LRNLAAPLSGPRDAALTLAAFENVYHEGLMAILRMTEDDSGPYWMVRVTRAKRRKKPEAYWSRLEPDQKCACCDALILDNLSFENAAYHPCADWWRWDYNQEQWICPCCWSKNN